jgi:Leucine carboxyl methyltransferase
METTLPAFTPIEESLFLTLCGRALDYRSPHSILSDAMADEIVRKLDYDCGKFRLSASPIINIALRAKKLDEVALRFVARNPDAVALDLGAGLDSRMLRINPPSTVDWYDVDFPEVISARRQLIPDPANAHGVGADLTDPDWLDAIPTDRPAVIVADGHRPFPLWRGGLQRLLQVRYLGSETLPRYPICCGAHQVAWLRRPPRTRTLEPQPEAGGGDPAHARTRGRPVPAGSSLPDPSVSIQRGVVPKRHHGPALPLLGAPTNKASCKRKETYDG